MEAAKLRVGASKKIQEPAEGEIKDNGPVLEEVKKVVEESEPAPVVKKPKAAPKKKAAVEAEPVEEIKEVNE